MAVVKRQDSGTSGLFDSLAPRPLADRLRPQSLDEVVGQDHLLGEGGPIRRMVDQGRLSSMVLWGPPGCGKTTLALLLARYAQAEFRAISAVLSGLADVRAALDEAAANFARGVRTVLFDQFFL